MILTQTCTRKAAIAGLGGVGKTQIALELAYRIRHQDPTRSVFWIRSTNMEAVEKSFMDICDALGLPNITSCDVKSKAKAYLSSGRAGPWLLIVDNADDADMWIFSEASSTILKAFLPQSRNGSTIFTTRNQQLANSLVGREIIKVGELNDKLAMDLLRITLVEEDFMKDSQSAKILIHQLGGLPLALIQAASFINQNSVTLDGYLSLLNKQGNTKVELLSENFEDDYRYEDIQNPVVATWLVSFEQIRRANSLATEYLSHIACIDPRDIPLSIFPLKGSEVEREKALEILKAYSFITDMSNTQFINMHRLVHLATRNWLRSEGMIEDWTTETGEYLSEIVPSDHHNNRTLWRLYLPHAQYILQSEDFSRETVRREKLSQSVARCLYAENRQSLQIIQLID